MRRILTPATVAALLVMPACADEGDEPWADEHDRSTEVDDWSDTTDSANAGACMAPSLPVDCDLENANSATCCEPGQTVVLGTTSGDLLFTPGSQSVSTCVLSMEGSDAVFTAAGSDTVLLDLGDDFATTRSGSDLIAATGGNNTIRSGAGCDRVITGDDHDRIFTGIGDDIVSSGGGLDVISTGAGDDDVDSGADDDLVWGGQGSDNIVGGSGDDRLFGNSGSDTITPGPGLDLVSAGAGDDTVVILDSCEITPGEKLFGGSGTDTLLTPVSEVELNSMGVTIVGFEDIQLIQPSEDSLCAACTCTGLDCCSGNGTCDKSTGGDVVICECDPGFAGGDCSVDVDETAPIPAAPADCPNEECYGTPAAGSNEAFEFINTEQFSFNTPAEAESCLENEANCECTGFITHPAINSSGDFPSSRVPVVFALHGQDRSQFVFQETAWSELANILANHGIATVGLRLDSLVADGDIGRSVLAASCARAILDESAQLPGGLNGKYAASLDPTRVGFIGHSQGGLAAAGATAAIAGSPSHPAHQNVRATAFLAPVANASRTPSSFLELRYEETNTAFGMMGDIEADRAQSNYTRFFDRAKISDGTGPETARYFIWGPPFGHWGFFSGLGLAGGPQDYPQKFVYLNYVSAYFRATLLDQWSQRAFLVGERTIRGIDEVWEPNGAREDSQPLRVFFEEGSDTTPGARLPRRQFPLHNFSTPGQPLDADGDNSVSFSSTAEVAVDTMVMFTDFAGHLEESMLQVSPRSFPIDVSFDGFDDDLGFDFRSELTCRPNSAPCPSHISFRAGIQYDDTETLPTLPHNDFQITLRHTSTCQDPGVSCGTVSQAGTVFGTTVGASVENSFQPTLPLWVFPPSGYGNEDMDIVLSTTRVYLDGSDRELLRNVVKAAADDGDPTTNDGLPPAGCSCSEYTSEGEIVITIPGYPGTLYIDGIYLEKFPIGDLGSCGDGTINSRTEECDFCDPSRVSESGCSIFSDNDLNGATCTSLGFAGGNLSCNSSCAYETSNCTF